MTMMTGLGVNFKGCDIATDLKKNYLDDLKSLPVDMWSSDVAKDIGPGLAGQFVLLTLSGLCLLSSLAIFILSFPQIQLSRAKLASIGCIVSFAKTLKIEIRNSLPLGFLVQPSCCTGYADCRMR